MFMLQASQRLLSTEVWQSIPAAHCTTTLAIIAFCSVSASLCGAEQLLVSRHRVYPHLLWDVVNGRHDPSADSPCIRDPLSAAFLQKYTLAQVTSNVAKAEVQALASIVHIDTTRVERRHALIRRKVLSHSLQAPRMSMDVVAAKETVRSLKNKSLTEGSPGRKRAKADQSAATSKASRRRGGGGSWRMYVRERMSKQVQCQQSCDVAQPCVKQCVKIFQSGLCWKGYVFINVLRCLAPGPQIWCSYYSWQCASHTPEVCCLNLFRGWFLWINSRQLLMRCSKLHLPSKS